MAAGTTRRVGARALALACALTGVLAPCAFAGDAVEGANGIALQQAAPPPAPAAMCLVDTGLDLNPGTTPVVIGRDTVVGGSLGDEAGVVNPPTDGHPQDHGTFVALLAAAPDNGWGFPGLAPAAVRIWSVKVAPPGSLSIDPNAVVAGVERCVDVARSGVPIRTISISLAAKPPIYTDFAGALADAKAADLNVVVAGGNTPGALAWPANEPGVIAVGADDASDGGTCSFSPGLPRVSVLAPGCDSQFGGGIQVPAPDDGTPMLLSGTSLATPLVAATLTALRAYAPSLSAPQAAACLSRAGTRLDADAVFNACGVSLPVGPSSSDPRINILGSAGPGTSDPPPVRRSGSRRRNRHVAHRAGGGASGTSGGNALHLRPHSLKPGDPPVIFLPA
jgi:hypothetical protein